jgi:hypothetical protein
MTVQLGVLALLEAKPGKGGELGAFLEAGRQLAAAEVGTVTWYAFKLGDNEYRVLDSFETESARQSHLNGAIPTALCQVAHDADTIAFQDLSSNPATFCAVDDTWLRRIPTSTGSIVRCPFGPMPSCPLELLPQAQSRPLWSMP